MKELDWRQKLRIITLLYYMEERGLRIPVLIEDEDLRFMEADIGEMHVHGFINVRNAESPEPEAEKPRLSWFKKKTPTPRDPDPLFYEVTDAGRELIGKLLGAFDASLHFNMFWQVALAAQVHVDMLKDDGSFQVLDHVYDTWRFPADEILDSREREELGVEDLRLAMMSWFAHKTSSKLPADFDPRVVVFVQKLADGKFDTEQFWFDLQLGTFFDEIDRIVDTSYKWTDLGNSDEESDSIAATIYASGMLEHARREGTECEHCEAALAVLLMNAGVDHFENCPICGKRLNWEQVETGPEETYGECPKCHSRIPNGSSNCPGCGAEVNYSLEEGTVNTHTDTETYEDDSNDAYDPFYNYGYYGYEPYGYYYPYDPFYDALAFAVVCDVLFW
ncbi:TPA: hypothetical protein DF272_02965 [Candidatus Falkowbacteria bacterium]|nr:hypothetical protein [Candidatus Falkowbacteria bacterium]